MHSFLVWLVCQPTRPLGSVAAQMSTAGEHKMVHKGSDSQHLEKWLLRTPSRCPNPGDHQGMSSA